MPLQMGAGAFMSLPFLLFGCRAFQRNGLVQGQDLNARELLEGKDDPPFFLVILGIILQVGNQEGKPLGVNRADRMAMEPG
jgi:hypothetical protein